MPEEQAPSIVPGLRCRFSWRMSLNRVSVMFGARLSQRSDLTTSLMQLVCLTPSMHDPEMKKWNEQSGKVCWCDVVVRCL